MYFLFNSTANCSLFNLVIFTPKTSKNLLQKHEEMYMKIYEFIILIVVNFLRVLVNFCDYLEGGDRNM